MIRELQEQDAEIYARVRMAALLDSPLSFGSSPEEDAASSGDAAAAILRRGDSAVCSFDPDLVGMVGVRRVPQRKLAHKAQVWGMFVTPSHRERGLGAKLLDAAIRYATKLPGIEWIHIDVSSTAPGAHRLYERAGFQIWGTEPDALRHDGESATEYHMAMHVDS